MVNKDDVYIEEQRELLSVMLDLSLRKKINNNETTDRLIKKIKTEGGENMLAILDMIDEENRRILNKGRNDEKIEIAKKLKEKSSSIEFIMEVTGLNRKQIEKL